MSDLKQKLAELEEKYRTSPNLSGYDRKDTLALLRVIEKLIEQRNEGGIGGDAYTTGELASMDNELAQLLEERTK